MNQTRNAKLTPNAKTLRKTMTKEERRLWYDCLKRLPVTVNRQKVLGRYIVDFYCASAKIVIELDGSQHFEEAALEADQERDAYLSNLGLTVLRYTNLQVNRSFKEVCEDVYRHIMQASTSSPAAAGASPQGEAKE
ncbi:MAG: endonuclease domain-containing protein [Clostridia bacterium]|nr:endonuclease domain-containing protein [Clostridia bacterium]